MSTRAKIQNRKNYRDELRLSKMQNAGVRHGLANQDIDEAIPTYEKAPCEDVRHGKNNTMIIFGRDRPSIRNSGYGAKGSTQCGRIDLIAGLASSFSKDGPPDSDVLVSPNFVQDASRIYISQRADIDAYMGLAELNILEQQENSKSVAAIGMKSDCIRMHARKNIKIITGKARFEGLGADGEPLSSGGKNEIPGTISFIAGNYTEDETKSVLNFLDPEGGGVERKIKKVQSLVKGDNMVNALEEIMLMIDDLLNLISINNTNISTLSRSLSSHFHDATPGFGGPSSPSSGAKIGTGLVKLQVKNNRTKYQLASRRTDFFRTNFLKSTGPVYINSRYVYTT
tara:strand:- start:494 stop:1516 length:1023 start_codon:yes stop_codon:yes gene_type:complete